MSESERRTCGKCGLVMPLEQFAFRRTNKGERQWACRACMVAIRRDWYERNRERHGHKVRQVRQRASAISRQLILDYLRTQRCLDCGEDDPVVLEFDHVQDKTLAISHMVAGGFGWAMIEAEIAKCEIRCANCHRRKTARERSYYRYLDAIMERRIEESVLIYASRSSGWAVSSVDRAARF